MIRKNAQNCKLNIINQVSKALFLLFMDHFKITNECCPSCHAKGMCEFYASYERNIIDIVNGKVIYDRLVIQRVICSCGHTHAILPDFIVPYRQYSLPFILKILQIHFSRSMTCEEIHETYGISHTVLLKWKKKYGQHKDIWLGLTRSRQTAYSEFLDELLSKDPFSGFTSGFYEKTLYSFMQSHANPANCCTMPHGWINPLAPAT